MCTEVSKDLLVTEYEKLRDEIHQRVDQRQQLLTYALIGAASFFSVGLQSWASAVTVLCYPVLAFFLACAWSQHDTRIGQINQFLRQVEDTHLHDLAPGWETYRRKTFIKKRSPLADSVNFSARGLFAGSELLALIIGLARFSQDPQMVLVFALLAVFDALAVLATLWVLERRRMHALTPEKESILEGKQ